MASASESLASLEAPPLGTVIQAQYELKRFLGAGGMGAVYEAVTPDGRRVAVKILLEVARTAPGGQFVQRFEHEAKVMGALHSPHIVPVTDAGLDDELGIPFMVMPLMLGFDLSQLVKRIGPLHPTVAVRIMRQACRALEVAHVANIIHRDIKPANLFLDHDQAGNITVRVLDFGIAKSLGEDSALTQTGHVLGTPRYMSPEQAANAKNADHRSDVWGLAATLYYTLAGVVAFRNEVGLAELYIALNTRDTPLLQDAAPWIDPGLALVVHGGLLRDVEARCPTVQDFAKALGSFTQGSDELNAGMMEPQPSQVRELHASRIEYPTSWRTVQPGQRPSPPPLPTNAPDPLLGTTIAERYTLLRTLGRGGMGAVYEAEATSGDRYAIKVIDPDVAGKSLDARRRFVREARAVTSIQSEHVVRVVEADADPQQQLPYIVMELLHGLDLQVLIKRQGAMPPKAVARLFVQAARGLTAAHAQGIVHRDIKPANLFLHQVPSGEVVVKICDFGIAKRLVAGDGEETTANLTRTGGVLGSPMYMSPEQATNAKHLDLRTDMWSLGASLYHALSGRQPWAGRESVGELILAVCTYQLAHLHDCAPWLPTGLVEVVHRAMRRNPAERFQSMEELAAALVPFTDGTLQIKPNELVPIPEQARAMVAPRASAPEGAGAVTSSSVSHTVSEPHRRPVGAWVAAATGGVLALAAAGAAAFYLTREPPKPAEAKSEPTNTIGTTAAPAKSFDVSVAVLPATARVEVDGQERALDSGKLLLTGEPGDTFAVRVADGDAKVEQQVFISKDGEPSPTKIEVVPMASAKPAASRTIGPAVGPAPSTTTAPTAAPTATTAPPPPPPPTVTAHDTW